jgi:hypothetical protein
VLITTDTNGDGWGRPQDEEAIPRATPPPRAPSPAPTMPSRSGPAIHPDRLRMMGGTEPGRSDKRVVREITHEREQPPHVVATPIKRVQVSSRHTAFHSGS